MTGNIIRLAELLKLKEFTPAERNEAINLTQSMFGTTAFGHRDHTMVAINRTPSTEPNDPSGAVARAERIAAEASSTVIGVTTNSGQVALDENSGHGLVDGAFKLGDDLYEAHQDKAGRAYYTKNGNRIKNADYQAAQVEADGDVEES